MYYLTMQFNGETYEKRPRKDIKEAILSLRPEQLHTDIFVTLKNKEDIRERHLTLTQGKKLFNETDNDFIDVFIMNLTLK
jgi:hypothetical protein